MHVSKLHGTTLLCSRLLNLSCGYTNNYVNESWKYGCCKNMHQCVWPFFAFLIYHIIDLELYCSLPFCLQTVCKILIIKCLVSSNENNRKLTKLFSLQDKMIWLWLKQISVVSMISVKLIFKRKSIHTA